jgi:hypothetical protein
MALSSTTPTDCEELFYMRQVFTSQDVTQVGYYKSILDTAGIRSFIQNENAGNPVMGGAVFLPSLCIIDDENYDEAIRILRSQTVEAPTGSVEWTCPSCGQKNPPNFGSCWNCSAMRAPPPSS